MIANLLSNKQQIEQSGKHVPGKGTLAVWQMTEMEHTRYDDVFLGILQDCGKIERFLEAIFSFLSRRTDYFHLMHKKDDKYGFPPGVAEKMLIKVSKSERALGPVRNTTRFK